MNTRLTSADKHIAGLALLLAALTVGTASQAFAVFGFGDLVFDPTAYATLGHIWSEDVSTGVKMAQELQQATNILQNGLQIYALAMTEAQFIHNKQVFAAIGVIAQHAAVTNTHGETSGWDRALTTAGGAAMAGQVWQRALQPGTSALARINLADSFGTDALMVIGSCNGAAAQNSISIGKLQQIAMDGGNGTNTAIQQANMGNLAQMQQLRTQQCQHAIANEQLKQSLLKSLQQRDLENDNLTFFSDRENYAAATSAGWTGASADIQGYLVP